MGRYEDQGGIQGILEEGFGPIARKVMRDPRLSIGAKGLYSYLVSFAGAGMVTWPRKTTICKELGIHHETYNKYLAQLIELDYVRVTPRRDPKGQFLGNLYTIVATPKQEANDNTFFPPYTEKNHSPQKPDIEKNRIPKKTVYGKNPDTEKTPTQNNNKIINNNRKQQQQHFLSNSSNNSHDEKLTPDGENGNQSPPKDHGESNSPGINNDTHKNNQDIEKEVKEIGQRLLEITGVNVDEKLISLLSVLPEKNREDIIEAITKYLQKNAVDNIDGLIATAMRNNWQPGKRSQSKKNMKKAKKKDKFRYVYQMADDNIKFEEGEYFM